MKKVLITLITVVSVVGAFAQGTINLNNYLAGTVQALVYDVNPANPLEVKQGNTAAGVPPGTQTAYAGVGLGAGYTAQIFGGAAGTAEDALQPVAAGTTTFRTTTAAYGRVQAIASVAIPGVPGGATATLQLRAWDNRGGTVTSWTQVLQDDTLKRGYSLPFNLGLGDPSASPPVPPANLVGLTSFQLFVVPEPSIIALGALGLGALILFRRRK